MSLTENKDQSGVTAVVVTEGQSIAGIKTGGRAYKLALESDHPYAIGEQIDLSELSVRPIPSKTPTWTDPVTGEEKVSLDWLEVNAK